MYKLLYIVGIISVAITTIWLLDKIKKIVNSYFIYRQEEIEKRKVAEEMIRLVKNRKTFMAEHFRVINNVLNDMYESDLSDEDKNKILQDYQTYLGLYEKIKTNEKMTNEDILTFSQSYLAFTNLLMVKRRMERQIEGKIDELFKVNVN